MRNIGLPVNPSPRRRADNLSPADRRRAMQAVRASGTTAEMRVAQALRRLRVRFRSQGKLPGRPDFVLSSVRAVLFVHGCFWHSHGCRAQGRHAPHSNAGYWASKLAGNRRRDRRNRRLLNQLGWRVLVVWECQINSHSGGDRVVARAIARARPLGFDGSGGRANTTGGASRVHDDATACRTKGPGI